MSRQPTICATIALGITWAACASDPATPVRQDVTLTIVNAVNLSSGAHLALDQVDVPLPAASHATTVAGASGSHRVRLTSATGATLVDTTIALGATGRYTVVLTGYGDTGAGIYLAADTIQSGTNGTGYQATIGSVLLVNSAQHTGPFDVVISRVQSGIGYRFSNFMYGSGSLPAPSPFGFYIPFPPEAYRFDIVGSGRTLALATTTLTLAPGDRWTVVLYDGLEGELGLQAVKQP